MRIHYNQGAVEIRDVLAHLNLTGRGLPVYTEVITLREAARQAREKGIRVADRDIQACADRIRMALDLYDAGETAAYLSRAGLTVEDFEDYCESLLLAEAFKNSLVDDAKIEAYFMNNRAQFEQARISVALVADENLANEIRLQVTEDGEDFHALARRHSMDETTRPAGGYVGWMVRRFLRPEAAALVFNASPGDLLGPFAADGGRKQLILVHEVIKPDLTEAVKAVIRDSIFKEWSAQFVLEGITINP